MEAIQTGPFKRYYHRFTDTLNYFATGITETGKEVIIQICNDGVILHEMDSLQLLESNYDISNELTCNTDAQLMYYRLSNLNRDKVKLYMAF
jgi:hypothetical protein